MNLDKTIECVTLVTVIALTIVVCVICWHVCVDLHTNGITHKPTVTIEVNP